MTDSMDYFDLQCCGWPAAGEATPGLMTSLATQIMLQISDSLSLVRNLTLYICNHPKRFFLKVV